MKNLDEKFRSEQREGYYVHPRPEQNLRDTISRERELEKKLYRRMKRSLQGIPDEILHKKHFTVRIGKTDNFYTCNLEKNTDILMPGRLIIGYGNYNLFSELLQEPRTSRKDAMWQLLYAHLGMRIPSEIVVQNSKKAELSFDSVEEVVKATSERWVQHMEAEAVRYSREIMQVFDGEKEEDGQKRIAVANRTAELIGRLRRLHSKYFVRQDEPASISHTACNTILILSADFQETSRIVTVDESVLFRNKADSKPRKLIHIVTADEDSCRVFFADDFYTHTKGMKKPRNQWECVRFLVQTFMDQEEVRDKYLMLLVPSRKEALFHKRGLGRDGYNDVKVKRIGRKPMSRSYSADPGALEK